MAPNAVRRSHGAIHSSAPHQSGPALATSNGLSKLYPLMGRFLRWTLQNRIDADGFVTGKCSWETGMDASWRFLIQQPTGGELIEFLRIVELQAATSHAAGILDQFAEVLGDTASRADWRKIQQVYAAKTQTLWKEDWFYDFDTRKGEARHIGWPRSRPGGACLLWHRER